jgi:hypothetical protein
MGVPLACAFDPFYSDSEWEQLRSAYFAAEPPSEPARSKTETPVGLLLEMTRLPAFEVADAPLPQALLKLGNQFQVATKRIFPESLLTPHAAERSGRISLSLKDVPVLECLRYFEELSGQPYTVIEDRLHFMNPPATINPWGKLKFINLAVSKALASHWFPKAKSLWEKGEASLWNVESFLDKQGVPFPKGTRAEFVPSMNILACVQSSFALPALQTLISETEAQLTIESALKREVVLPPGMELRSLKTGKFLRKSLSQVMARSGQYLEPRHGTTSHLLEEHGVSFPKGSSAWFEHKSQTLYVINTPAQLHTIEQLSQQLSREP